MKELNLKFYTAHSLEILLHQLSYNIAIDDKDILLPTKIVTQTKGINSWIEQNITKQYDENGNRFLSIFMNYSIQSPMEIIIEIFRELGGKMNNSVTREDVLWNVYNELQSYDFQKSYPKIANYYHEDEGKQYELAVKISDLFDQYEVYRMDMISSWKKDTTFYQNNYHEEWQKFLWRKVYEGKEIELVDKIAIKNYIINTVNNDEKAVKQLKKKFSSIHFFGLVSISSFHAQLLHELSKVIEINFYLINHAPHIYWAEDKSEKDIARLMLKNKAYEYPLIGNELLINWAKLFQETNALLYKNGEFINYEINLAERYNTEFPNTLLGKVQESIHNNQVIDDNFQKIQSAYLLDKSIVVANNHSIIREVQSLYNYLIDTLAHYNKYERKISDRNILVIVNDINKYAPYIKAVFDNGPVKFYYNIADESINKSNNITAAIIALLELNERNFSAEKVLALLKYPSINQRFKLQNEDLITRLVTEANIRYGIDNRRNDDTYLVSFRQGLKRLMYGACMDGERIVNDDIVALNIIDSNQDLTTLNNLCGFVLQLIEIIERRKGNKSIKEWKKYLEQLIVNNIFIDTYEEEHQDYIRLLDKLTTIEKDTISDSITIPYDIFKHHISSEISYFQDDKNFIVGGITFCTPIPFRSVPFDIVCMLGMNANDFPRKENLLEFDLKKHRIIGDRNIKYNDKQLMIETLMSAQKSLYISYIGQDIRTNKEKPPSILVDELLNYIQEMVDTDDNIRKHIVIKNPLHNYSTLYNKSTLNNYLINSISNNEIIQNTNNVISSYTFPEELNVYQILSFFKDPVEYYFKTILGIYLNINDTQVLDTEQFTLDALEQWSLKSQLFAAQFVDDNENDYWKIEYLKGALPLKNTLNIIKNEVSERINSIMELVKDKGIDTQSFQNTSINIALEDLKIVGTIPMVNASKQLLYSSFSKENSNNKYKLHTLISFLIGKIQGSIDSAYFVGIDKESNVYIEKIELPDNPLNLLKELIAIMKGFYTSPFLFNINLDLKENYTEQDFIRDTNKIYIRSNFTNKYYEKLNSMPQLNNFINIEKAHQIENILFKYVKQA